MKLAHPVICLVLCLISAIVHGDEPSYPNPNHADLSRYLDESGQLQPVRTNVDWETRRQHILANVQRVMGPLPKADSRVPLDVKEVEETRAGKLVRRKITFQSDAADRVPAWVMFLDDPQSSKRPAVLCLHQTTAVGKDEPAGIRGDAELKYALELAERGYVAAEWCARLFRCTSVFAPIIPAPTCTRQTQSVRVAMGSQVPRQEWPGMRFQSGRSRHRQSLPDLRFPRPSG